MFCAVGRIPCPVESLSMKSRLSRLSATLAAVVALAATGTASAQYRGDYGPEYDYAEVLSVDPIIDVVEHPVARDECWEEPVVVREPVRYHGHRDRTPALLGGIVGGVIGSQFGSGSGRDAATAAGAILGYTATRDSQRRHGGYYSGGREYRTYEQRCTTRTDYRRDERVNGYDVTYRYNGRVYNTVTDYHPGDRIRVEVSVNPAQ
jgi:uncharacterized protein YcfJ